ncbi:acetyl-CoA decarbonylase/synthase complex subunit gamma [bacterium]|nr:acetyl-CoA decarbonylase/synthase complex subunit gamma [bacterium]
MKKLTGLQIQKYLPKTNCKECGSNTCLAFAMKLAAKKADLADCPYASDEAKAVLGAASEPPVKGVAFGTDRSLKIGEETVFYRHEKTFVHQSLIAVNINDTDSSEKIESTLQAIKDYQLIRVGETLTIDMVAITQKSDSVAQFVTLAKKAWSMTQKPIVLHSQNPEALIKAAEAVKDSGSLIAAATAETADMLMKTARENNHALAVTAADLDSMVKITSQLKENGFNEILLQFQTHSLSEQFQTNSIARKSALTDNFKPLGYPTLRFIEGDDYLENIIMAVNEISKFGGIFVLPEFDPAQIVPLMTARMNIFTDPQKPIQVEPGVYPVGEPNANSPVFVTTNFSLTYFIISGEIENSGLSAWLVVPECEGMSVLTSWAAGKFSGSSIAGFIKESDLESKVNTREIIIPGYVSQISGELEENLPGWKAIVGPQESADLESFITNVVSPR